MKALVLVALAACDPGWTVHTTLRDPANHRISDATVAVACGDGRSTMYTVRTDADGVARVGSIGPFPKDCDLYVAKPGYATHRVRYASLCPSGGDCMQLFRFDFVLRPEVL